MSETVIFDSYPEISFIDDISLEDAMNQMKGWYQERYEEITGTSLVLQEADSEKLRLDTIAMMYYQVLMYLDFMAKQNLLKYSTKAFLDNIAARCGLERKGAVPATVTMRFVLSAPRETIYTIPMGTRCTSGDDVFFFTKEDVEIPAGEILADVKCECTVAGEEGNQYGEGDINSLVDTLPYIQEVFSVTDSAGGADEESDDDLAERIYLSPASFSTAGCEDAYIYWSKNANNNVGDVNVFSPQPCEVTIIFNTKNGGIPENELIDEVTEYLNEKSKKVLGDRLTVKAPNAVSFEIDASYYINETDRKKATAIKEEVAAAMDEYKTWQCEKIGRDINPSKLEYLMMLSGAKRVEIRSPVFKKIGEDEMPQLTTTSLVYGGIEDD